MTKICAIALGVGLIAAPSSAQHLLAPMDFSQRNHLKAYGLAYHALERGETVEWLLNYRGGAFLFTATDETEREARLAGITVSPVGPDGMVEIRATIANSNMESVLLEKAPEIAVYTPPNKRPWDDAVTLALTYAGIPYTTVWDDDVLRGELNRFDWLHLHHEDFTGQLGKFWSTHRHRPWYREEKARNEEAMRRAGARSIPQLKLWVAEAIREYTLRGGFLFAMCSATETIDVALASAGTDIVDVPFDGSPPAPDAITRLDFSRTFAFTDFEPFTDPMVNAISTIDVEQVNNPPLKKETKDFRLFDFAAKYDPVPAMLVQNHVSTVRGFYGQTTSFHRGQIKDRVIVLADVPGTDRVRYLHGNLGEGTFTFLGGHDPEDPQHLIEDRPTDLDLHPTSPGYRLILNNVLFPAARKKKLKT